jgi:hypothetical protein
MIGIPIEIQKQLRNKNINDERFANIVYTLMVHCHQPFSEIMRMPVPMVLQILKRIEQENKETAKQNRKMK